MRLGSYDCKLVKGTKTYEAYNVEDIAERHRHRFEFNNDFRQAMADAGLTLSGISPDNRIVEMVEVEGHPFYIGTQAHPEFKSRPNKAHPLFAGLVKAAVEYHK